MNVVNDKWLSVVAKGKEANIKIHGVIGGGFFDEGVTDAQVEEDLKEISSLKVDIINVDLSSLGGSVFHGTKIYNLLKENPAKIMVDITGATASMGTVIAMAGDSIKMVDNTHFLVHEPRTISWGVKSQLAADLKMLEDITNNMAKIYAERTGNTINKVEKMMAENGGEGVFWTAKETKEKGFVDEVYKPEKRSRAAALITNEQLKQFKINAKLKQNTMKFNLIEVGKIVKSAFNSAFITLPKEEQTHENIEALISTSTELVVGELQKEVDAYKTEQEEKYNALETKYNKLNARSSESKGEDAGLDVKTKLTNADKAAKEFVSQLSDTDRKLMTNTKN